MKIAIFATNPSFLSPVLTELNIHHDIEIYEHIEKANWYNIQNIRAMIDWCDVAFFDFAHWPLAPVSWMKLTSCKIVVRLHGQGLYSEVKNVNWKAVDHLIMSVSMRRKFVRLASKYCHYPPKITTLPLGIDLGAFKIPADKTYGKNLCTHATSIYWKKRVYATIQMFYDLIQKDDEWTLYIRGKQQSNWLGVMQVRYVNSVLELIEELGIADKIKFSENSDIPKWIDWLKDKDVFVSNSIEEGFHVSLAEAIASGLYPVINCWQGALDYYPDETVCKTQSEMVNKILEWSRTTDREKLNLAQRYRQRMHRYDSRKIAKAIREIIEKEALK